MKKAINIRMDEMLIHEIDNYAKELDTTRTYIIEKAIVSYFDKLDEIISDKRIDAIKNTQMEIVTLEQVAPQLGLH